MENTDMHKLGFAVRVSLAVGLITTAVIFTVLEPKKVLPLTFPDVSDPVGTPGESCWDRNKNFECDLPDEDINQDGVCDWKDCQGPPGDVLTSIPCDVDDDCDVLGTECTINTCVNETCMYMLPLGKCTYDGHCTSNQICAGCSCVDVCNDTTCQSDGCIFRHCVDGQCQELESENGCCNEETDCLGLSTVYYFTSGLYTDKITSKTAGNPITIEGVDVNDGALYVPGGFYSYLPALFNSTILVDVIGEFTNGSGVSIETAFFSAGNLTLPGILKTDTIEGASGTALTVGGVSLDDGAISGTSLALSGSFSASQLNTDTIDENTPAAGITLLKPTKVDTITGRTGTSVTVAGVINQSGGIKLASTGGIPASLNYYAELEMTATITGLWRSTEYASTFRFVRIGGHVTFTWGFVRHVANCAPGEDTLYSSSQIPSNFRPPSAMYFSVAIEDNGVIQNSLMQIGPTGYINWYSGNPPSSGGFSCSTFGYSGFMTGSVSWVQSITPV